MNPISQSDSSLALEIKEFVGTLFLPEDLIELRLIETWTESGKHRSEVMERLWLQADSLVASCPTLRQKNQIGANIFYGVNPRTSHGSTKSDVAICRTLWADLTCPLHPSPRLERESKSWATHEGGHSMPRGQK
ncbi:MAG: hypothetical protein SH868_00995, partial [Bythopirellula sp.]|nr:hypothetical protein [Bythopirellula sp.]